MCIDVIAVPTRLAAAKLKKKSPLSLPLTNSGHVYSRTDKLGLIGGEQPPQYQYPPQYMQPPPPPPQQQSGGQSPLVDDGGAGAGAGAAAGGDHGGV